MKRYFQGKRCSANRYNLLIPVLLLFVLTLAGGCKTARVVNPYTEHEEEIYRHVPYNHISKYREKIIKESHKWLGTPYKYGGSEIGEGTDCSGLVLKVYLKATEIKLPRVSTQQGDFCKHIKKSGVKPGDLVFFATGKDPDRVSHVGIMIDEDNFIHASSSKGVVIASVSSPYFSRTFKFYGRVPGMD